MSMPSTAPAAPSPRSTYRNQVQTLAAQMVPGHLQACGGDRRLAFDVLMAAYTAIALDHPSDTWGAGLTARRVGRKLLTTSFEARH